MHRHKVKTTENNEQNGTGSSSNPKARRSTGFAEFLFYFLMVLFLLVLALILNAALREAWQWIKQLTNDVVALACFGSFSIR